MSEKDDMRLIRRRQVYLCKCIDLLEKTLAELDEHFGAIGEEDIRDYEDAVVRCAVNPAGKLTEYFPLVVGDPAILLGWPFPPN